MKRLLVILSLILFAFGCQDYIQNTQPIQADELVAYVDQQGNYRVPTWAMVKGTVEVGNYVFKGDGTQRFLLPRESWATLEIKSKLNKTTNCDIAYDYTAQDDFTLDEGELYDIYVFPILCTGSTVWYHKTITISKGSTFTNAVVVASVLYDNEVPNYHAAFSFTANASWSSGHQFDVYGEWEHSFTDDEHVDLIYGRVELLSGGSTDSATFDYIRVSVDSGL